MSPDGRVPGSPDRVRALWRYFLAILAGNLAWETLHLPLYAVWQTGTSRSLAFAVAHCTAGDLLIAAAAFAPAWLAFGRQGWPDRGYATVAMAAIAGGVGYTLYSEWANVYVRRSWSYADAMPLIPPIGIGVSPVLQWLIVPGAAFLWARLGRPARPARVRTAYGARWPDA